MTDVLIKRELLEQMRNFTVMHDSGVAGVLRGSIDATLRNQPASPGRKAFKRGMPEWLCAHCGASEIFHEPGGYCQQAVTYSTATGIPGIVEPSKPAADRLDRNAAFEACPATNCDWGSFYQGWKAAIEAERRERDKLAGLLREAAGELRTDRHHGLRPKIDAALSELTQ